MPYTTPACPGFHLEGFSPHPCGRKLLPVGAELCSNCIEARRRFIMDNLQPTDPRYPRSSKPLFGGRGAERRLAQQPAPRAWGTQDGQVANTPATTSPQPAPVVTDVAPVAPDLVDPLL